MVTGPGTWLLSHGEQGVGDVREQAVQVEHVGLHRRGLGLLVHLIRPFLQLGLADLTLEQICQSLKKQFKANFLSISDLSIRGLPTKKKKRLKRQSDALMAFGMESVKKRERLPEKGM